MRRKIALNPMCLFGLFAGFALTVIGIVLLTEQDGIGWLSLILALVLLSVAIFVIPILYLFDEDGVTCVYLAFSNERYLWKSVSSISLEMDSGRYHGSYYQIHGRPQGERKKHMNGEIRKTFRTQYLLHRYWEGNIENEKKRKRKHKPGQSQAGGRLDDSDVKVLEREIRAKVRSALESIFGEATDHGLCTWVEYIYLLSDGSCLRSRPEESYTYLALVTIAEDDEGDSRRRVQVSSELISVRKGRSAYIGVEKEKGIEDLVWFVSDTVMEIRKNGIEAYGND